MARLTSSVALRADFGGGALPGLDSLGERELRLLRSFAVVVSAGGLSPAAATLGVDLSTVSRQLRETEAWLGVALARRGRGGFAQAAVVGPQLDADRRAHDGLFALQPAAPGGGGSLRGRGGGGPPEGAGEGGQQVHAGAPSARARRASRARWQWWRFGMNSL